jgi:hypothetical protein
LLARRPNNITAGAVEYAGWSDYDRRGAIVLRQKWSRGQVETRLANLPPCLIGTGLGSLVSPAANVANVQAIVDPKDAAESAG